jgi:hypothetical protein
LLIVGPVRIVEWECTLINPIEAPCFRHSCDTIDLHEVDHFVELLDEPLEPTWAQRHLDTTHGLPEDARASVHGVVTLSEGGAKGGNLILADVFLELDDVRVFYPLGFGQIESPDLRHARWVAVHTDALLHALRCRARIEQYTLWALPRRRRRVFECQMHGMPVIEGSSSRLQCDCNDSESANKCDDSSCGRRRSSMYWWDAGARLDVDVFCMNMHVWDISRFQLASTA